MGLTVDSTKVKASATIRVQVAAGSGIDQERMIVSSAITKVEFVKKLKTQASSGQPGKMWGNVKIGQDSGADSVLSLDISVGEWKPNNKKYVTSLNEEFPIDSPLVLGQQFDFAIQISMSTDIPQWGGASSGNREITVTFGASTAVGNDPVDVFEIPADEPLSTTAGAL